MKMKSTNKITYGITNEQQTNNKQITTNKNNKNNKNIYNMLNNIYRDFSDELKIALDGFVEMRKKIKKPLTERALQLALKKLKELSSDEQTQIKIINQSVEHGWQTFYPLNDNNNTFKQKQTNFNNYEKRDYTDLNSLYKNGG